jgi:hypothetical protein
MATVYMSCVDNGSEIVFWIANAERFGYNGKDRFGNKILYLHPDGSWQPKTGTKENGFQALYHTALEAVEVAEKFGHDIVWQKEEE